MRRGPKTDEPNFYQDIDRQLVGQPPIGCWHVIIFLGFLLSSGLVALWLIFRSGLIVVTNRIDLGEISRPLESLVQTIDKKIQSRNSDDNQLPEITVALSTEEVQTMANLVESSLNPPVKKLQTEITKEGVVIKGVLVSPLAVPVTIVYWPNLTNGQIKWTLKSVTLSKIPLPRVVRSNIDQAFQPFWRKVNEPLGLIDITDISLQPGRIEIVGRGKRV